MKCGHDEDRHWAQGCDTVLSEVWHNAHDGWEGASKPYRVTERCLCSRYVDPIPSYGPKDHGPSLPLRLAAEYDEDDPAHRVLMQLNHLIRHGRPPSGGMDAGVNRAGWLTIFGRSDPSAVLCVKGALGLNKGPDLLPFDGRQKIDLAQPHGAEWYRRLRPVARTAAVELVDPFGSATETLTDPETHAPVIRTADGTLWTAVPRQLPTTSPLTELIFGQIVWVRTESGTLYPAPHQHHRGYRPWDRDRDRVDWPTRLAHQIHLLLDDITAIPTLPADSTVPETLRVFTEQTWPANSVFTRNQLESIRSGKPVE
jgi:hypothetical protein